MLAREQAPYLDESSSPAALEDLGQVNSSHEIVSPHIAEGQSKAGIGMDEPFYAEQNGVFSLQEVNFHPPVNQRVSDLVEWDGPGDPENPMNMSFVRKVWITCVTGMITFVVTFASSVFSTTVAVTARQFGTSEEVMVLGVTLYVLGFATGPLLWAPAAEFWGRRTPLLIGIFGFIIFQIPVAVATNLETIFICRFLAGAFGSSPLAIVPGMYVDYFETEPRALATILAFSAAGFCGPSLGPIVGEFTVKNLRLGWTYTAWFTMIMAAFFFVLAVPTIPETLAPIILQRKAARLRRGTKNWALHSKRDEEPISSNALMMKYGLRPLHMLVREPILVVVTLYVSLVYGILYLIFFAFPYSYQVDRGWDFGVSSVPFIGIFLGMNLASAYAAWETKVIFTPKIQRAGKLMPEERLPPMIAGSVILVIGLFWFAWTSFRAINPWPQITSGVFIGAGTLLVFLPALNYLVDVYVHNANSALAANTFVRSFVAAAFPLFSTAMYSRLGVQWATSLLAFLCLALVPAPILFYKYGKKIRGWSRFAFHPEKYSRSSEHEA